MDNGVMGAIFGAALGLLGAVIGTAGSLRAAKSTPERHFILKWACIFFTLIISFLIGIAILPGWCRDWLWIAYSMLLPCAIIACNRGSKNFDT